MPDCGGREAAEKRLQTGSGEGREEGEGEEKRRGEGGKHSAACKFDLVELSVAYIVSCEVTVAWLSAGYNEFGIGERGTTGGLGGRGMERG